MDGRRLHTKGIEHFPMYTTFSSKFCKLIKFLGIIVSGNKQYRFLTEMNMWQNSEVCKHGGRLEQISLTSRIHGAGSKLLKSQCQDVVSSLRDR